MIQKLYAVLIKDKNGEETIFAMSGLRMTMQAVTSKWEIAAKALSIAQQELPEADLKIVKFERIADEK